MRGNDRRAGLVGELAVSVASGLILAVLGKVSSSAGLALLGLPVPLWALVAATTTVALVAAVLAYRLRRGPEQAFVVISTLTGTMFLTQLLEHLTRALAHHGIDLVVRLPHHDHSGRSQRKEFASLLRKRRAYLGGFIVADQPAMLRDDLVAFGRNLGRPVIFLDRRPFADADLYPPGAAFVGSDPAEIGALAADWTAKEFIDRQVQVPTVLVVGGDGQGDRQLQFMARLRERLPTVRIELDTTGQFDRDRAREIVGGYLARLQRRGEALHAVFCTNDEMAMGAADALRAHGTTGAAGETLVVGVDGNAHAVASIRAEGSALRATVSQDPRRIAEVAVDRLLCLRANQPVPTETFTAVTVYPLP